LKLGDALADLTKHLEEAGARFALVGGLAVSAHGEARFTRDIDLVVAVADDDEAETHIFGLRQKGYQVLATVEQDAAGRLATARMRDPSGVVCDLIFATCGVEEEIVGDADDIELFGSRPTPTASAESLVAMKVLSASDERPRDLGDLYAIIRNKQTLDEERVIRLLRMIDERGFARGQDLLKKWQDIRKRFKD
jgi:hypothetical protein